jgi:uncharacterized protein (TIGR02996 family)
MNLAEHLVVAELTGQPGPKFPGERFLFIAYNPELESGIGVWAEGPTPFTALLRGVRRVLAFNGDEPISFGLSVDDDDSTTSYDPATWRWIETLPEAIRNSGNRSLIGFLLYTAENQAFNFKTRATCYLDEETVRELLPGAQCLFAWTAAAPRQEEAYGLFAVPSAESGGPGALPRPPSRTLEENSLLQAINRNPKDDARRLVYADWLEENGRLERAEFIRVQIALAGELANERRKKLHKRETKLLSAHGAAWRAELPDLEGIYWGNWKRGFVCAATIAQVKTFKEQADAFFAAAPIEKLFFRDHWTAETVAGVLGCPELERVTTLDCSGCPLTPAAVASLARCPYLNQVTELNLSSCHLGSAGVEALAQAVSLSNLRSLFLAENDLDGGAMQALADATLLEHLTVLDLCNNQIGPAGAQALARSTRLSRLEKLNLISNSIGPAGARALADSPLLPQLRELRLTGNQIGDEGVLAFANSTQRQRLAILSLSNNGMSTAGALALANSTGLPALTEVVVYDRPSQIGPEGVAALRGRFGKGAKLR